jgi:hypothetical protein
MMPVDFGEEQFGSGRLGNSRSRPGFMRPSARMLPLDILTFFNLKNRDQAFAITVQRIKDILTGKIATRVSPAGGLALARHASNTVPVLASTGGDGHRRGRKIWVQTADPVSTGQVEAGDVWVK